MWRQHATKKTASGWCLNPWIVLYFSLLEHECCCCCCVDVSVVHRIYYGWIVTQYYGCYGFCVACSWYGKPMTSMIPIQTSQFRTHYIYSTTVCVRRFVWNCVYYKCCYVLCAALACARNASMTRERERSKKKKYKYTAAYSRSTSRSAMRHHSPSVGPPELSFLTISHLPSSYGV